MAQSKLIEIEPKPVFVPDEKVVPGCPSFYKDLLDNLHDGVYFVDRNRSIVYWNEGAKRLMGYPGSGRQTLLR